MYLVDIDYWLRLNHYVPNVPVSADNFLHLMGWGDFNSSSGVVVNVESALGVAAIWAAVNFISGTLASFPLEVMRRTARNRRNGYLAWSRRKPLSEQLCVAQIQL